jgi:hypothetical protein
MAQAGGRTSIDRRGRSSARRRSSAAWLAHDRARDASGFTRGGRDVRGVAGRVAVVVHGPAGARRRDGGRVRGGRPMGGRARGDVRAPGRLGRA